MAIKYLAGKRIEGLNSDTKPANAEEGSEFKEINTGNIYRLQSGIWTLQDTGGTGGEGNGGGNTVGGVVTRSGNAANKVFTIPHGIGGVPQGVSVVPSSIDAIGDHVVDVDDTNITITYQVAPPSGTDNLEFIWMTSSGGGTGDANTIGKGSVTKSGDASTKTFSFPHGMTNTPVSAIVTPTSTDALGNFITTVDSTNVNIAYAVAPPSGTDNLTYYWIASDANGANVLNTTNIMTVTNKSINISDNTLTATNRATGDLVKDNGTKYERFPRGTAAGQTIQVNAANNDIEYSLPKQGQYGEYLYKMYIDPVDSLYKVYNYNTNVVEFTSATTTDCLTVFNSMIAAAHTAKKPVFIDKGKYLFSAAPSVAGKYVHVVGVRTGGYAGGKGDYTNETVLKKNYTGTGIFIHWDARSVYCKQQWKNVVIEGRDSTANGLGTWEDAGTGFEINSISEVWDAMEDVMICHFAIGLEVKAAWEMGFWNVVVYNVSNTGIHFTDETSPARAKSFECKFWGGEIRGAPIDVHIEKGDHIAFEHYALEGVNWLVGTDPDKVLYNTVNVVKIGSEGANSRFHGCSFENPCQGIEAVLDDGFGTVIDSCRFGGTTWTAQTIYRSNVGNKCKIINNSVHPYTASAVATILLSSTSTFMTVKNNDLIASAGGASLVITDSSGDTSKNTLETNSSRDIYLANSIGPATTFRSGATVANGLTVTGGANISSATITGAATIGTTLGVTGATTLSSTLAVTGATTLSGTMPNNSTPQLSVKPAGNVHDFEYVADFGLTTATDRLLIFNTTSTDDIFSPNIRAETFSASYPSTLESLYLQSWIRDANDTGTTPIMVFQSRKVTGSALTNARPLFAFKNFTTDIIKIHADRMVINDATNLELGTTTGTKIGTATTQKIGFYNATPVVQGASIADITTTATGTQISVAVNAIISRLEALGLIATV